MFHRALAILTVIGMAAFSGCCSTPDTFGPKPPKFKVCNGSRLLDELGWFYADVQDMIFGVDYYYYMDHEFSSGPY